MVASKSIKFEISLKELKVTFEGDIQSAERMHGEITGAINSLASAQSRMLSEGHKAAPVVAVDPILVSRRSRRTRRRSAPGIDAAILEGEVVAPADGSSGDNNGGRSARRSGSGQQSDLIKQLKGEGFFGTRRTNGDIRAEMAKKGHSFKSNQINPTLVYLTQNDVLKREKDAASNQWVYFAS
jgi:hypothetical protein